MSREPYIGSYIAAVGPILLAAAVDPGWLLTFAVAGLFLVTEPLAGQVAEPMLYGRSTGLSPISVVISVIFWTWLWGPVGLILATPLTFAMIKPTAALIPSCTRKKRLRRRSLSQCLICGIV